MRPVLKQDTEWDADSVHLRFWLSRPVSSDEKANFELAVNAWGQQGIVTGFRGVLLAYLADEYEWYDGEQGRWVQVFADFYGSDDLEDFSPVFEALLKTIEPLEIVSEVWVGSDYEDWPYPAMLPE